MPAYSSSVKARSSALTKKYGANERRRDLRQCQCKMDKGFLMGGWREVRLRLRSGRRCPWSLLRGWARRVLEMVGPATLTTGTEGALTVFAGRSGWENVYRQRYSDVESPGVSCTDWNGISWKGTCQACNGDVKVGQAGSGLSLSITTSRARNLAHV